MPRIVESKNQQSDPEGTARLPAAIKVVEMNFGAVREKALDEDKSLLSFLKRRGLLKDNYGYSAFNPEMYEKVLSFGQYRYTANGACEPEVYCCRLGNDPWGEPYIADLGQFYSVLKYCEDVTPRNAEAAMIAIYDLTRMKEIWAIEFEFKPEALVGVVKLMGF